MTEKRPKGELIQLPTREREGKGQKDFSSFLIDWLSFRHCLFLCFLFSASALHRPLAQWDFRIL